MDNNTVTIEKKNIDENNHTRACACGCVPPNMFTIFEMAEKRKKYREEQLLKEKLAKEAQLTEEIKEIKEANNEEEEEEI